MLSRFRGSFCFLGLCNEGVAAAFLRLFVGVAGVDNPPGPGDGAPAPPPGMAGEEPDSSIV